MSARLHPHAHLPPLCRQITVELLRFLSVLESPFLELSSVRVHKRNLLKARVVIDPIMIIVRLLSPEPFGWFGTTKVYSGVGADIVMESITLLDLVVCEINEREKGARW
jgi:hypothetical protein